MKVTFTLPAMVAAIITSAHHAKIVQACESCLNAGKVLDDETEVSMKNRVKDNHADATITLTTRQQIGVVSAFVEYCGTVERQAGKVEKLGGEMKLKNIPATFKGQAIGEWVAKFGAKTPKAPKAPKTEKPAAPIAPAPVNA